MISHEKLLAAEIELPVEVRATAVYFAIYDARDRLLTFIGMSDKALLTANLITDLINGATICGDVIRTDSRAANVKGCQMHQR